MLQGRFLTRKRNLISNIANLLDKLPYELPNNIRLKKLENMTKVSNSSGGAGSAQSPFQILNFDNSSQIVLEIRYWTFLVLPSFTRILQFVRRILSAIVVVSVYSLTEIYYAWKINICFGLIYLLTI